MRHSTEYIENRIDNDEADALCIEDWLNHQDSPLPWSAWEWLYDWAHENPDAWPLVTLPKGMLLNDAQMLMAVRGSSEPRYNQYHAKDGKFTTKGGVGGIASSWSEVTVEDARVDQAALNVREFGCTERQGEMLAERQIPEGMRVFKSGDGKTFVHPNADVDDAHLGQMFADLDGLEKRFPTQGNVVINVQPRYKFTDKALGETVISKPVFRFSDDMVMGRNIKRDPDQTFHPAGFYADPRKNLLAHEYGHAIDTRVSVRNAQEIGFWKEKKDGLSRYGRGYNASEGFAEAFSDFITTPKVDWMPATASYAARFGWEGK